MSFCNLLLFCFVLSSLCFFTSFLVARVSGCVREQFARVSGCALRVCVCVCVRVHERMRACRGRPLPQQFGNLIGPGPPLPRNGSCNIMPHNTCLHFHPDLSRSRFSSRAASNQTHQGELQSSRHRGDAMLGLSAIANSSMDSSEV